MSEPVRRKVLLLSGRRTHRESIPLDGTRPMPQVAIDEEVAAPPPAPPPPPEPSPKTRLIAGKVAFAAPQPNEDTMKQAGVSRTKVIELFNREKRWLKVGEVAEATGMTPQACKYHLRALEMQGQLQAAGSTTMRRYAHLSVSIDDVPPAKTEKKPRKPALRRKTARAKRERREKPVTLHELPAPVPGPMPEAPANDGNMVCAINDSGAIGITKGPERIALEPTEIRNLLRFLTTTRPLWRTKRAA
jgi:hypothetical protein